MSGVLVKFAGITMDADTMEQENPGSFSLSLSVEAPDYFLKTVDYVLLLDPIVKPKFVTWTINAIVPVEVALTIQDNVSKQLDIITTNAPTMGFSLEIEIDDYIMTKSGAWIVSYTLGDYLFKSGNEPILMQAITIVAKERKVRKGKLWSNSQ